MNDTAEGIVSFSPQSIFAWAFNDIDSMVFCLLSKVVIIECNQSHTLWNNLYERIIIIINSIWNNEILIKTSFLVIKERMKNEVATY